MKRKIIGHRGAAGIELENTATSLERAASLGVSGIEFDVRLTRDKKVVLCHDRDLMRIAGDPSIIAERTLAELQKIPLLDGSRLITLHDALKITGNIPVIIETKDHGAARPVLTEIKKFPDIDIKVASFNLEELALMRDLAPDLFLYGLERTKPIESIHLARLLKLNGIGLNYWLLNPFTHRYARHCNLKIYVYTVNNRFIARFISWLYPDVAICTDHPEWFVSKRRKAPSKSAKIKRKHPVHG